MSWSPSKCHFSSVSKASLSFLILCFLFSFIFHFSFTFNFLQISTLWTISYCRCHFFVFFPIVLYPFPLFPLYTNSFDFYFICFVFCSEKYSVNSFTSLLFSFFPFSLSSGIIYLCLPSRSTNDKDNLFLEANLLWFVFFV